MERSLNNKDVKNEKANKEDLVITPGGPRPRHLVHRVGPDEMITHDKEGNPIVVRRQDRPSQT